MTGWWPRARSLSTTWEPMKPEPPVTSTRIRSSLNRPVIQRRARMVSRHPVAVGQRHVVAHDAVAGLVVDPAGGALEPVEDDVLVQAGDHSVGQLQPGGVLAIQ